MEAQYEREENDWYAKDQKETYNVIYLIEKISRRANAEYYLSWMPDGFYAITHVIVRLLMQAMENMFSISILKIL